MACRQYTRPSPARIAILQIEKAWIHEATQKGGYWCSGVVELQIWHKDYWLLTDVTDADFHVSLYFTSLTHLWQTLKRMRWPMAFKAYTVKAKYM